MFAVVVPQCISHANIAFGASGTIQGCAFLIDCLLRGVLSDAGAVVGKGVLCLLCVSVCAVYGNVLCVVYVSV